MSDFIQALENLDQNLFQLVNDMRAPIWDDIMWYISYKFLWIPLYLVIIFLFYRAHGWKGALWALLGGAVTVILTDVLATYAIKEVVMRYRPTHNLDFGHLVNTVTDFNGNEYRGGKFGFVSNHAANSFAIAFFAGKLVKKRFGWLLPFLIIWALIIGYSRIYLGVHYPADVVCGAILGGLIGYSISVLLLTFIIAKEKS